MAEAVRIDFGTTSDPGRHGPDAGAMHWNCFAEPVLGGKHPAPIVAADGLELLATVTNGGACRGKIVMGSAIYGVYGTLLAKISASGTVTEIGGVPGTANVSMSHNDRPAGRELVIVTDGNRYVCSNDILTDITDPDLPAPVAVTFLNQRIIYGTAPGEFYWSEIDDATDIDPLSFATAEGNPDRLVTVFQHLQEIRIFGEQSIEPWIDTGNTAAQYRRNAAGVIPKGCLGGATVKALDADLFWVGDDQVVYRASGYQGVRISHHQIESDIRNTSDKTSISALTYHMGGHAFYVLSGPTWTWAFNRTTGAWDPRFSYGESRWRCNHAVQFDNSVVLGDFEDGRVYRMSRSAHDEAGTTMVWRVRSAPMHAYPNRLSVDRLHLDFVTGVGLNSTTEHLRNPLVGLRWSDDGGRLWSRQREKPLGLIGKYKTRVTFDKLGVTGRTGRIWEVEVSSPVVRSLMYAAVEGDEIGT